MAMAFFVATLVFGPVLAATAWAGWRFWRLVITDRMLRRMHREDVMRDRARRAALGLDVPTTEPVWRSWR